MAALTSERDTVRRINSGWDGFQNYPVKAGEKIFQGSIVALDANGDAEAATTASTLVVGRARQTVDNTAGADGDLNIEVDHGVFRFAQNSSNKVALPSAGGRYSIADVIDDQTVDNGTGGGPAAGRVIDATADTVDILMHPAINVTL